MTIAAQRYQSVASDFNVPIANFQSLTVNEILNAPQTVFNDLLETATALVEQFKESNQDVFKSVKTPIDEATRFTQDIYGAFTDLAAFPQTAVAGIIDDMFPDSTAPVRNLLKNMTAICRNKALGGALGFKNRLKNPKCGGLHFGAPKCAPETAASLINQSTAGALGQIQKSINNLLKQIVGLGNLGFGANLCGVFAAITQGLTDKSTLTMAAGILLNQQGISGNLQAVFDISKNLNDRPIVGSFPGTIRNIAQNMSVPLGNFQNAAFGVLGQVTGSFEAIDSAWNTSEDGMLSVAGLGDYNSDLGVMYNSATSDHSLDLGALDTIQTSDDAIMGSSYMALNNSSSINDSFLNIFT